jgi:hypothetical protein
MTIINSAKGLPLSVFVDLDNEDGSTYDPSLYTYDCEVRSYVDNSLKATLSVTGATADNGDTGVQITDTAAHSALIPAGIYRMDVLQTEVATGLASVAFTADFVQAATVTAP